jgi:hypothetical protein
VEDDDALKTLQAELALAEQMKKERVYAHHLGDWQRITVKLTIGI